VAARFEIAMPPTRVYRRGAMGTVSSALPNAPFPAASRGAPRVTPCAMPRRALCGRTRPTEAAGISDSGGGGSASPLLWVTCAEDDGDSKKFAAATCLRPFSRHPVGVRSSLPTPKSPFPSLRPRPRSGVFSFPCESSASRLAAPQPNGGATRWFADRSLRADGGVARWRRALKSLRSAGGKNSTLPTNTCYPPAPPFRQGICIE
jgi:hypothetical protein